MPDKGKHLSARELAEQYGIQYAYLRSDPTLWKVFQDAVKNNWTSEKFLAKVKETDWYLKQSDTRREATKLKITNPAQYAERLNQTIAQMRDAAKTMGATVSWESLKVLSERALMNGWNEAQVQDSLSRFVKSVNGVYGGQTGSEMDKVAQSAWRNGIKLSAATQNSYARKIAAGDMTPDDVQRRLREQAKALAPGYADQLDAGMDLYDIASPYMESMAHMLELNPGDIDLYDPTIRKAMSTRTGEGKPATLTISEFETQMRKDKRWMKTNNARDTFQTAARSVLRDFGVSW